MEKKFKSVPNMECLRYKGTAEKPDIKVFVSHRIDQDSETIDNPLYIPVRCGAVYDKRENIGMLGDDTGDNISEKRMSFCELTVLYWAWKNVKADYYGLCQYRRYISFSDQSYKTSDNKSGFITEQTLNQDAICKFSLDNEQRIRKDIESFDIVTTPEVDLHYEWDGEYESVYSLLKKRIKHFDIKGVDSFIRILKEKYPDYALDADFYFSTPYAKYYNCFVMRKSLFDSFCSMLFDVLFELEKCLNTENYNLWQTRMPGFMAEHLFGIFYLHSKKNEHIRTKENELVKFENVKRKENIIVEPAFNENNIPIVFSASDYFAPYSSVFIQSIIEHSKSTNNYDIIILQRNISERNQQFLLSMIENRDNFSIRFVNPRYLLHGNQLFITSSVQAEESYYRVLVPYILKGYKKIIATDCDLIVCADIAELFYMDLNGKTIGAASDAVFQGYYSEHPSLHEYCNTILPMKNPYSYVNTGVLLIDVEKFRKKKDVVELVKFISTHNFQIQEQDALNLLFEDDIYHFDIAWNMYAYVNDVLKIVIDNYTPLKAKEAYYIAHKDPKILHWAAQPKPWDVPDIDYGYKWWQLAYKTPFFGTFIARISHGGLVEHNLII